MFQKIMKEKQGNKRETNKKSQSQLYQIVYLKICQKKKKSTLVALFIACFPDCARVCFIF